MTYISRKFHAVPNPDAANSYAKNLWQPVNGCCGINHAGDEGPCPTRKVNAELGGFKKILRANNIRFRSINTETMNIFCRRIYLMVNPENLEKAKELAKEYQNMDTIKLFFAL